MSSVRFLEEAAEELEAAVKYYDAQAPDLGQSLVREVERLCSLIIKNPRTGSEVRPYVRRRLLRRFPFSLLYSIEDDEILIVAVAHHRREPGYWRERF